MYKRMLLWLLPLVLAACGNPGDLPFVSASVENPVKGITYESGYFRPIDVVCYIDTSKYNPLNALDYSLENSGIQFFDYVILGGAYIYSDDSLCGFYLDLSDELKQMLEQRNRLIVPLQKKGIKVLLGIQCGNDSFGNMTEDEMNYLAKNIYDTLQIYWLDGAEFYDNGAPALAYPSKENYSADTSGGLTEDEWLLDQWSNGGESFNNIFYTLRRLYDANVRDNVALFLREANYGRYLSDMVTCTSGQADFSSSNSQITYSFNANSMLFPKQSAQRQSPYRLHHLTERPDTEFSWLMQYGPLHIELDGGSQRNVYYPYSEIFDSDNRGDRYDKYYQNFFDGDYPALYFHNLKSVTEAAEDPYYNWPDYNASLSVSGLPEETGANPKTIPPAFMFSKLSLKLFNENVICSGGNHLKDW